MSSKKSAPNTEPPQKAIEVRAASSRTRTITVAAGKHVTTNRVTSSTGTREQTKSSTYEYLKVKETVTTESFPEQNISGPGCEIGSFRFSQNLYVSCTNKSSDSYHQSNGAAESEAYGKLCVSQASNNNYTYASAGYAVSYDSNTGKSSVQVYQNWGNNKSQNSSNHKSF